MVESMQRQGVVEPSVSPWASPVVLTPKKDGTLRFCVDYRRLNAVTRKDVYPLPRIDDILDTLGKSQHFSTLDLAAGYWQIELDPASRQKSAFTTHGGLYDFVRMPFGLCNAPATFQRVMQVVLAGLEWKCCFAYLDDILVSSPTVEDHLEHLQLVFDRLRQAGLKLKPNKCFFLRDEVTYLGHTISKKGIAPDPLKTKKMREYPVPTNVTKVQQFLGLSSYYRRFVSGFAKIAGPLHALLKKGATFKWTLECQQAFDRLKQLLVTTPVLAFPRFGPGHDFILETDASALGLGAVLAQRQDDGQVHPIAYASRSLQPHERNYGISELETLGLVWAVKYFRAYLLGHHCVVYTDHSACTSLLNSPHPSAKLARWAMVIQEMDLEIKYRPGKANQIADALSRNPPPLDSLHNPEEVQVLQLGPGASSEVDSPSKDDTHEQEIASLQRDDSDLLKIMLYLEGGVLPDDHRQAKKLVLERTQFELLDGVLHHENPKLPDLWRIAVPKVMRPALVEEAHAGRFAGHFGERKIYHQLRKSYWWEGMRAEVRRYCRACFTCATRKGTGRRSRPPLQPIPVGSPLSSCRS